MVKVVYIYLELDYSCAGPVEMTGVQSYQVIWAEFDYSWAGQ